MKTRIFAVIFLVVLAIVASAASMARETSVVPSAVPFASVSQPHIVVYGAGTCEANGLYTFRGTNDGKPYYNLIGKPDDVTAFSIVWAEGGAWVITGGGAFPDYLYYAEENVPTPDLVSEWFVFNGAAPVPTVATVPAFARPMVPVTSKKRPS